MEQSHIPPVIAQAHKTLSNAETTMRQQCAMLSAAAGKDIMDADKMVEHMDLFLKLICLDLASADGKITEEEAELLNAIFQQSWPAEQYAALHYDLHNEYPDLISRDMGSRLLACNITIARLMRETYDPKEDWLLKTIETIGETVIRIDRDVDPEEKKRLAETMDRIHKEALSLLEHLVL
ncbi:MAG TPA: hypothetical protein DCW68_03780 [Rhodospirillaceae bacterium]|nr:MAG: hypothetical protein A2018_07860 [Alphaproteobacteria bacterium GWF2_58_20]HAU29214.1 hypothetical protein [Rhodospirillaceae bacterium]